MPIHALFIVDGPDAKSTKQEVLKLVDPMGASNTDDRQLVLSKSDRFAKLHVEYGPEDTDFAIPVSVFEDLNISLDHPAAPAFWNTLTFNRQKYVLLDDSVAELAAQHCRSPK